MNVKKSIVAIATSAIALTALGSLAANAATINTNPATIYDDVSTYSGTYVGTYADFKANVESTSVVRKSAIPANAAKHAYYAQYKLLPNGTWNLITYESINGFTSTVSTPPVTVGSNVAKRIHEGYVRANNSLSSPIKESYRVVVIDN